MMTIEDTQMSNTNTGGPAFPFVCDAAFYYGTGMTLRDYFAAKALQGILAGDHPITHDSDPLPTVAKVAYAQADAMLSARGTEKARES
jgi:hypothetical protein